MFHLRKSLNSVSPDGPRRSLDMESNSEVSSEVLFEQPYTQFDIEEQEYSRLRRIKKRTFDFMRDHYKTLLMSAALIIFAAILIIIGLSVVIKIKDAELGNRVNTTMKTSAEIGGVTTKLPESRIRIADFNKTLCDTINCTKANWNGCRFKEFDYTTAMIYSCCGCLPLSMKIIRFEELPLSHTINLVLSVEGMDPRNMSQYDLKALEHLPYLTGSWNVVKESNSIYYLKYGGVELDPPIILESGEVSNDGSGSY